MWQIVVAGLLFTQSAGITHFAVSAAFEPSTGKLPSTVAVTFSPTDPDVKINERPEPRLNLDALQIVLDDKQPPAKGGAFDPETVKAIDLTVPVRFPVALRAKAPKGEQVVRANVVYFYCSKREGWCRRGNQALEFPVNVP